MHNGVFCIPEYPANIYIKGMYNAKAYSAADGKVSDEQYQR